MQLLELQLRLQNHAKPQEPVEVVDGLGRDVKGKINGNVIVTAVVLGSENDLKRHVAGMDMLEHLFDTNRIPTLAHEQIKEAENDQRDGRIKCNPLGVGFFIF